MPAPRSTNEGDSPKSATPVKEQTQLSRKVLDSSEPELLTASGDLCMYAGEVANLAQCVLDQLYFNVERLNGSVEEPEEELPKPVEGRLPNIKQNLDLIEVRLRRIHKLATKI